MIFPTQQQIDLFKNTQGAISVCEMCAIAHVASLAPEGNAVDLGSHAGKSSIAAAVGLRHACNFYLVDPVYDLTNQLSWSHTCQKSVDNMGWPYCKDVYFHKNVRDKIAQVNPHLNVQLCGTHSLHALQTLQQIAYIFIDSDQHQENLLREELHLIIPKLCKGAIVAFHDYGNQFTAVEKLYNELIQQNFGQVEIDHQAIKAFVGDQETNNLTWHATTVPQPLFVGALWWRG